MKNIFILTLTFFILINLFYVNKVFAAKIILNPSNESLGIGEQFYVDLMLDPENISVNAIKGEILFNDKYVSFVRAEEGKSMIDLWVEKPKLVNNSIHFAGVISTGFDGVIDPFNKNQKLPGPILRLIFETKKEGDTTFSSSSVDLNLNDGLGTEVQISSISKSVKINSYERRIKYTNNIESTPELYAYVTKDPLIYDGKFVVIFNATDKETGIKSVKIKEGRRDWKDIESPYLLVDQSRHSDLSLQATNYSGASVVINIDKVPYDWNYIANSGLIYLIFVVLLILILRKIYVHNFKK